MRRSTGCALTIVMLMVAACGGGTDEGTESPSPTSVDEPTPTTAGAVSATTETEAPTTTGSDSTTPTTERESADPYDSGSSNSDTTKAPTTTSATAPSGGGDTLAVSETDMGTFLTTGDGWSLYLFTVDEQGGESACYDDCEAAWPPLTGELTPGEGVDEGLMGTVARDDGSEQVTYNGWPLYYFANDAEPGDTNGQGANDVWFLVTPEGEQIP